MLSLIIITAILSTTLGYITYLNSNKKNLGFATTLVIGLIIPIIFSDQYSFIGTLIGIIAYYILIKVKKTTPESK